jgi:HK97 family phage portal protein
LSEYKTSLGVRVLNWAAKQAGFSVIPTRRLGGVEPFFKFFGNAVVYGNWNTDKYISDGYMKNASLYSIVNRITGVAGQAAETFRVYKVKSEAKARKYQAWTGDRATKESILGAIRLKQDAYEIADNHPFTEILEKPNEWQGMNEFLQTSIGFKLLTGNRYLFLLSPDLGANRGKPTAIYNLPPQHINIIRGDGMWTVAGYEMQLNETVKIPAEAIVHSRYWNPFFDMDGSHLYGLSPLAAAARRMDVARLAEDRTNAMMRNAGAAGLVYNKSEGVEPLTVEEKAQMNSIVNDEIMGLKNAQYVRFANGDLGFLQFGMKAADLEILKEKQYSDESLCNIYKVPPGLFQAAANATDNNIQAWNRQLVTQAVLPALADVRDDLNKILYNGWGEGWYVDYDVKIFPEMQEDLEKQARALQLMPYLNWNEKRVLTGHDEDMDEPMMQKYIVPNNLVDLTTLNPDNMDSELESVDEELARRETEEEEE